MLEAVTSETVTTSEGPAEDRLTILEQGRGRADTTVLEAIAFNPFVETIDEKNTIIRVGVNFGVWVRAVEFGFVLNQHPSAPSVPIFGRIDRRKVSRNLLGLTEPGVTITAPQTASDSW